MDIYNYKLTFISKILPSIKRHRKLFTLVIIIIIPVLAFLIYFAWRVFLWKPNEDYYISLISPSSDPELRADAIQFLSDYKSDKALCVFIRSLEDSDARTRMNAARALLERKSSQTCYYLLILLNKAPHENLWVNLSHD
jgi:hypothetical protein